MRPSLLYATCLLAALVALAAAPAAVSQDVPVSAASYVGGSGDDVAAGAAILADGTVVVAGTVPTLAFAVPTATVADGPARLDLVDAQGRTVRTRDAADGDVRLDVSGLAPGAYWVRLSAGGRQAVAPVVVVR